MTTLRTCYVCGEVIGYNEPTTLLNVAPGAASGGTMMPHHTRCVPLSRLLSYTWEEVQAARAEGFRSAHEWRPIEMAPKDGTRIWAWFPFKEGSAHVVRWGTNVYDSRHAWTLDDGESATQTYDLPTRWQPLPTSPQERE